MCKEDNRCAVFYAYLISTSFLELVSGALQLLGVGYICISYTHFHELVSDAFACARGTIVVRFLCISQNHFRDLSLFHIVQVGWIAIVGHCVGCIHTCLIP